MAADAGARMRALMGAPPEPSPPDEEAALTSEAPAGARPREPDRPLPGAVPPRSLPRAPGPRRTDEHRFVRPNPRTPVRMSVRTDGRFRRWGRMSTSRGGFTPSTAGKTRK